MGDRILSLVTSKGWNWFWFTFSAFFFGFGVATGAVLSAVLMGVLSVFWAWQLRKIYNGTHVAYNQVHGKQV